MSNRELTPDELIFVKRMLPHYLAGHSVEEAARLVLEDDGRLLSAVADESHQYQGFGDASHSYTDTKAQALRRALCTAVYHQLRQSGTEPAEKP